MRVGSAVKRKSVAVNTVGFTITELLVVMGIIGILAAIVFPVVIKAKESAKVTECLANMKQLGSSLNLYLNDYTSRFPTAVPWGSPSYWSQPKQASQKTIQELLTPYVRNNMQVGTDGLYHKPGVFCCPSDIGIPGRESVNGVPPNEPIWKYSGCSYEYYSPNQVDWQEYNNNKPEVMEAKSWTGLSPEVKSLNGVERIGAKLEDIISPTRKAVMGDTWYWHMGDQVPDGRLAYRNTLFADGHAARVNGVTHEDARLEPLRHGWHTSDEVPESPVVIEQ